MPAAGLGVVCAAPSYRLAKGATDKVADKTKDAAKDVGNKMKETGEKIKDKAD